MRVTLLLALSAALATQVKATLPVVDYSHIAQDAAHQVVNAAHYASTELNTLNTQINTLKSYENSIVQLARMGDPSNLRNLPVVGSVLQLVGSGEQLVQQYQQIRNLTNPQFLQSNLNSLTSAYSLQRWDPLSPGAYQFPAANYSVAQTTQDQMTALEKLRQEVEQKLAAAIQAVASATDQSTIQKQQAAISAAHANLADISARESELAQRSQLQQQQLQAGAQVFRQQTTEQGATTFGSDVNNSINTLQSLSSGYGQFPKWPSGR